jgi:hypothetical protein
MDDTVNREQPRAWFVRFCPAGGAAGIYLPFALPVTDIAVPEIQFKIFPVPPFPSATLATTAISGCIHMPYELFSCTSAKQESE